MNENGWLNRVLVSSASIVIILAGIKSAGEIIVPFLLSLFIAIICWPLIRAMTARRIPLLVAITLLFIGILILFLFFAGLVSNTIREFSHSIPQYRTLLVERIHQLNDFAVSWHLPFTISKESILENFDPSLIMNFVSQLLLGFSGVVTNFFVLLLVVVLMLFEVPAAKRKLVLILTKNEDGFSQKENIDKVLKGIIDYLGIKTIISLITAVAVWILLLFYHVQYAVLWAVFTFLFNYIPNIGSIISAVPIIVQTLLLNGLGAGIGVFIGIIIINLLLGNVLEPKMMGKKLGLSTLVVFLSLLFWGWLLGTVGMLLSVPLTMVLKMILEYNVKTKHYACLLGDVDMNDSDSKADFDS